MPGEASPRVKKAHEKKLRDPLLESRYFHLLGSALSSTLLEKKRSLRRRSEWGMNGSEKTKQYFLGHQPD